MHLRGAGAAPAVRLSCAFGALIYYLVKIVACRADFPTQ
jgi:hypothetical protein